MIQKNHRLTYVYVEKSPFGLPLHLSKEEFITANRYQGHNYYLTDELLANEHRLIRDTPHSWVKRNVSTIIEEYLQNAKFPKHLLKKLREIGASDPYIPQKHYWAGFGQISYGMMKALSISSMIYNTN